MIILGIYGNLKNITEPFNYHDSSFSLIKDGIYVGSFQEERFSRKKYDSSFPLDNLIDILRSKNLRIDDIDVVSFVNNYNFPPPHFPNKNLFLNTLKETFKNSKINLVDHHTAHAMCSFLTSKFNKSNILCIDGLGSQKSFGDLFTSVGNFGLFGTSQKNPFNFVKHSEFNLINPGFVTNKGQFFTIGNFYSTFSNIIYKKIIKKYNLNFSSDNFFNLSEQIQVVGKIMGLGAYGEFKLKNLPEIISVEKEDNFSLPQFLFNENFLSYYHSYLYNLEPEDLAFWLQQTFENIILKFIRLIPSCFKEKYLCISGGCGLNILLNSRILKEKLYNDVHVHPATCDSGLSLGAALIEAEINQIEVKLPKNLGCVGNEYDNKKIKSIVVKKDNTDFNFFSLIENLNLYLVEKEYNFVYNYISECLFSNKIVAWFQGKSEYGPRALGNRSILANPCFDNKLLLNEKVKKREFWRPYAASVLEEYQNDWFDIVKQDSYYMLFSSIVKKEKRDLIPSIVHKDNTCRIQTVNRDTNLHFYNLIYEFYKKTHVPILLNTSFNTIKGEPIVETPIDALRSFISSEIDVLVINNFIITKDYYETYNGKSFPLQTN